MKSKILEILKDFSSSDFYIAPQIPQAKLNNAFAHYPVPTKETILGLVDATVFGSAKNGMAFGINGIYWKNDWTTTTARNFLAWDDLHQNIGSISTNGPDLIIAPGCAFNLAGSSVKPKALMKLLTNIVNNFPPKNSLNSTDSSENSVQGENETLGNLGHKPEISPPPPPKNGFVGSYNQDSLRIVNSIAKRHRLSRYIHVAPAIPVSKVKNILGYCGPSVDPYSILVVVDNTFLQSSKDFLIVTESEIISKGMMRNLDKFSLNEVRSIRCEKSNFFINNHDFQLLDELTDSEVLILCDFLKELIPSLTEKQSFSRDSTSPPKLNSLIAPLVNQAFVSADRNLRDLLNEDNDPEYDEMMGPFLKILYNLFAIVERSFDEDTLFGEDYRLHQLLLAYTAVSAFSFNNCNVAQKNEGFDAVCIGANIAIIAGLIENKGPYMMKDPDIYAGMFEYVFSQSRSGADFAQIFGAFAKAAPEDQKAIIAVKKAIINAVPYLNQNL